MEQIRGVVFDWAGTMVDFGSRAPMGAFVEAFARFQVKVSVDEARRPMGLPKRDHIKAMLDDPEIAKRWQAARGHAPTEADIDELYDVFVPLNEEVSARHADLIPGVAELVEQLRKAEIAIGSTTGYVRSIMERVLPVAAEQGYAPDNLVCADDVSIGRPTAMMMYKCFVDLGIHEPWRVVKVDDTTPGIAEGGAAGCWTVGISLSGNEVGLSHEALQSADESEVATANERASDKLREAGSDYVIDTVADLQPILTNISERISRGERPDPS
ncbi:MAG: phosphonoacetaldehyde hydrolase [Pseudomonadota bacterium]